MLDIKEYIMCVVWHCHFSELKMNVNKKKLIGVALLCLCILCLCVVIGVLVSFSKSNIGVGQKKYVSWASKVIIDPQKLYPVVSVVDGDTIKTIIDGHSITVRLLGINTPEVVDPRKSVECFGPEASAETKTLLTGKSVILALNPNYEKVDIYGRLLAYAWLDDLFVNEYLVKEGYAYEYTFNEKNPYQYQSEFKADELVAKKESKGLWGKCSQTAVSK